MADTPQAAPERESKVADMAELIKRLCVALTNVEMFSADHPMARKSIEHAYEWLKELFGKRHEKVVISVAGKRIVLDGLPLEERNPLVSKLAAKLDEVHINNLFFGPDTTSEEFQNFYRVLGKGAKVVNAGAGFAAMLAETGATNIELRDISYVMVTGDQKVVSRDAQVVEGNTPMGVAGDSEMVKYMIWKVLQKADEQKWMINEIKNNPQKMADMILDGLELAMSRAEMGIRDEEGSIDALLTNIRRIGEGLVDEQGSDAPGAGGEDDVGKALMTLENEIRLRSSKLMSSKVASGFVNEILHVVTGYADRARAKEVTDEFVKGEDGLKRAEKLLREMAPKTESTDNYITRIRGQLERRGLKEEDLEKLLKGLQADGTEQASASSPEKPKKPRKPRVKKPVSQAVSEGLAKRLKELHLEGEQAQQVTENLGSFIEERAKERAGEFRQEAEHLKVAVERRGRLLEDVPVGVVIWDGDGKIEFINAAATAAVGLAAGAELSVSVRTALKTWPFPLVDLPEVPADMVLTETDMKLLTSVMRPVKDAAGDVYGAILLPPREQE